jgi:hypothetical protein
MLVWFGIWVLCLDGIKPYLERRTTLKSSQKVRVKTPSEGLIDALSRIRERGQSQFTNPLTVKHYEPDLEMCIPGDLPFFYIAEVRTEYWLGIIPRRQYRNLFAIYLGFYDGAYGKKEINCVVFDRSLLDIAKEEIQKYADAFQASAVNLTQDFAR